MSQLKLSHDGADVDMSRCLRKVVLVQNALRRSSPVLSRYGLTPLASPSDDSDLELDLELESEYEREPEPEPKAKRATPTVIAHGFARPPSATSAGVITLVLRPPTPPPSYSRP